MQTTLYEQAGGEGKVRAVVDDYVDHALGDVMIGFFFARTDVGRLKRLEFEHAAALLGGPVAYSGRPLPAAHARRGIRGGHFARRLVLLDEALRRQRVPAPVAAAWLAEQQRLRDQVVQPAPARGG